MKKKKLSQISAAESNASLLRDVHGLLSMRENLERGSRSLHLVSRCFHVDLSKRLDQSLGRAAQPRTYAVEQGKDSG